MKEREKLPDGSHVYVYGKGVKPAGGIAEYVLETKKTKEKRKGKK